MKSEGRAKHTRGLRFYEWLTKFLSLRGRGGNLRAVARRVREAAVDEHAHFGASVLRAPLARRVVGQGVHRAVSERRQNTAQRDVMVLDEVAHDRLGALLAELSVHILIARLVGVARHLDEIALSVLRVLCDLVERGFGVGRE